MIPVCTSCSRFTILSSQVVSLLLQSVIQEVANFRAAEDTLIDQDADLLEYDAFHEETRMSHNQQIVILSESLMSCVKSCLNVGIETYGIPMQLNVTI